jgi:metal-responsive CopG/Arc/MetJ family transcriptional regulator
MEQPTNKGGRPNLPIKRTLLNVTPNQLQRLDTLAQNQVTTRSALVRQAIDTFLQQQEEERHV